VPEAIGGEEKLVVNEIKPVHSHEPRLLHLNDLQEICITKKELLNLDQKLSLRVQIHLVTMDNSSTCPICQPSSNGTNLQFQLCILWGIVNIRNVIEEQLTEFRTYSFLCMRIYFEKWPAWQLSHRWHTYRSTC